MTDNPTYTPTRVERATEAVLLQLSAAIRASFISYGVSQQQGMNEDAFRRVLALYFTDRTLAEWCTILGIADATTSATQQR